MSETRVVNVKVRYIRPSYNNLEEWMKDPNNVYIGRCGIVFINGERFPKQSSRWCNPFKITRDCTREQVIERYREYIIEKITEEDLVFLRGKTLGCWCKPEICHGDVLVELIDKI